MITQWNDAEDELLQGLPLRAQIIYLRGLRRYMNYKTGVVGGVDRRISLKMLGEVAESYNNRQREQPGKKEVIVSLDQLKKVGLIERVEDSDYLIFFLCKADRNQSVQNNHGTTTAQPRHNHGTNNGTNKPSIDEAQDDNNDTQKNSVDFSSPGTTAHIGLTDNGYTESSLSNDREEAKKEKKTKFQRPTIDQVKAHIIENQYPLDADLFFAHYEANGWVVGKARAPMKCWKSALVTWAKRQDQQKSLGDRTSQNQGSINNAGNYTRSETNNGKTRIHQVNTGFAEKYAGIGS